jgi:Holliday junction resolvasome RuvABC DNA-binding subunit
MKLLCVNAGIIITNNRATHSGDGLKEGEIYETVCKPIIGNDEQLCYYIKGLGAKLCCRFAELLDDKAAETVAEKTIQEQIAEAVEKEDYETAEKLSKQNR